MAGKRGSCLCGAVTYAVHSEFRSISYCHCSFCRKAHGSAFGAYAAVPWDSFKLLSGAEEIRSFDSSDGISRSFCKTCGSTLQFIREGAQSFGLAVGTLDDDPECAVVEQIFHADKAPWFDSDPEIPAYDAWPPQDD